MKRFEAIGFCERERERERVYLLIEITVRIEGIVDVVKDLEGLANFPSNGPDLKLQKNCRQNFLFSLRYEEI